MQRGERFRGRFSDDEELESLARRVIGAAIAVHRELGPGFLESIYEQALAVELSLSGVDFERQVPIAVSYRGVDIGSHRLDFVVSRRLIVELKAVEQLLPIHHAQLLSYLKATDMRLGLLINFNSDLLKTGIKRVIR